MQLFLKSPWPTSQQLLQQLLKPQARKERGSQPRKFPLGGALLQGVDGSRCLWRWERMSRELQLVPGESTGGHRNGMRRGSLKV